MNLPETIDELKALVITLRKKLDEEQFKSDLALSTVERLLCIRSPVICNIIDKYEIKLVFRPMPYVEVINSIDFPLTYQQLRKIILYFSDNVALAVKMLKIDKIIVLTRKETLNAFIKTYNISEKNIVK